MTEQKSVKPSRSRVKRDSRFSRFFIALLVVGISAVIFWSVQQKYNQILTIFGPSTPQETSQSAKNRESGSESEKSSHPLHSKKQDAVSTALPTSPSPSLPSGSETTLRTSQEDRTVASTSGEITKDRSPAALADELEQFFHHLDQQPYMADFHLPEASKPHFSKILQKLLEQPPATTRETDDYFTLLKNTAHFFRIIGKENTLALKGILDRERDSLEPVFSTFFALTNTPEILKERFALSVTDEPLYDYACFFLNTIGGRLYLFRRDSTSRMVVSYYAIRIIDRANAHGYNRLGIDLRPFIDTLIDEMENSGGKLRNRESYLDVLYDMKEKYGNGA